MRKNKNKDLPHHQHGTIFENSHCFTIHAVSRCLLLELITLFWIMLTKIGFLVFKANLAPVILNFHFMYAASIMRCYLMLCLAIVTIVRATPVAQIETDVSDEISFLPPIDESANSSDPEYAECGQNPSKHASNGNFDDSQSENIFRRETAYPTTIEPPTQPRIDPTKIRNAKQKPPISQDSCAKYPNTKIGTCQGPENQWLNEARGWRYVLNCLDGN